MQIGGTKKEIENWKKKEIGFSVYYSVDVEEYLILLITRLLNSLKGVNQKNPALKIC